MPKNQTSERKEYEEKLLEVRRVTKVTTGGRRLSFRATVLIGNRKWKIGVGTGKGVDVSIAVKKAVHDAYKHIQQLQISKTGSILYPIMLKNKACLIKLLPAAAGTGLKAWSSVRLVLELAGYTNMLSKIVGSNNKLNNALTTIEALMHCKLKESHKKIVMSEDDLKVEEEKREKEWFKDKKPVKKSFEAKEKREVVKKEAPQKEIAKKTPAKKTVAKKETSPKK